MEAPQPECSSPDLASGGADAYESAHSHPAGTDSTLSDAPSSSTINRQGSCVAERYDFDQPKPGETLNKWFKRNCVEKGLDHKQVKKQAKKEFQAIQTGTRRSTRARKSVVKPFSISFALKQTVDKIVRHPLHDLCRKLQLTGV